MSITRNLLVLLAALWLLPPMYGSTMVSDADLRRAQEIFRDGAIGAKLTKTSLSELEVVLRDAHASQTSREYALEAMGWLDIDSKALDLDAFFKELMGDQSLPGYLRAEAAVLVWQVKLLSSGLGPGEQLALLRRLAGGQPIDDALIRRWAAWELCARGQLTAEVEPAFQAGYGKEAPELSECRRQIDLVEGGCEAIRENPPEHLWDSSFSRSFRRLVLKCRLSQEKSANKELVRGLGKTVLKAPTPGDFFAAKDALEELVKRGWRVEQLISAGVDGELAVRVVESADRRNAERSRVDDP